MTLKFWVCLALTGTAVLVQFRWLSAWLWTPDFALITLVTLGFFLGALEILCYSAFAAWLLNWRPVPAPELVVFLLLPLVLFLLRKAAPWESWASNVVSNTLAVSVFYAAAHSFNAWDHPDFILSLAAGLAYGAGLYVLLRYVVGYELNSAKKSIFQ
jgi:hypothetical protein